MNLEELNSEFEVLFEDLATAGSKGLDNYEKSLCYTYAQDGIIKNLARQGNLVDIQNLIDFNVDTLNLPSVYRTGKKYSTVSKSLIYLDYFLRSADKDIPGVVVPQIIINSMLTAAYQYPPKNLAYVVVGEDVIDQGFIVFPPLLFAATAFVVRYVKEPTPVILKDLSGSDTIRELTVATEPLLKDAYHTELVTAAVQFAVKVYIGQPEKEARNDAPRNQR